MSGDGTVPQTMVCLQVATANSSMCTHSVDLRSKQKEICFSMAITTAYVPATNQYVLPRALGIMGF